MQLISKIHLDQLVIRHHGSGGGSISRYFSRDNTSTNTVSYEVKLLATSGHSSSPFESSSVTVIVNKDPRANFTFGLLNNPTGHSSYNAIQ